MLRAITDEDIREGVELFSKRHHTRPLIIAVETTIVRVAVGGHTACLSRQLLTGTSCYCVDDTVQVLSPEELASNLTQRGITINR